jgi:malonyl-CoA/methylmalonyl-CoA synthetase
MKPPTLTEWFEKTVSLQDQKIAVSFLRDGFIETEISYARLNQDINQFAHTLLGFGVQKGDRVVVFIQKSLVGVTAHLAILKIGAIAVPLNPGFKQRELEYLLNDADAKLILADPEKKALIQKIVSNNQLLEIPSKLAYQEQLFFKSAPTAAPAVEVAPDDPGLIIYTSGTTGNPKGAVLTQKNLVYDARNIIDVWEIDESDVLCHALPLFHVHGLCFALHTALLAGSHVLMLDQFDAKTVVEVLSRKNHEATCNMFMAVPAMYSKILEYIDDRHYDLGHMRLITSGSAPLLAQDFERIKKTFGLEPVEREGMSETGMNFSNPIVGQRKPGSIGIPLPDVQIRIVNPETLIDVDSGKVGELWLKGHGITPGYWRKPKETADTFQDGWFRTGDLGKIDEDGYYYLTDRIKHIIITGGENVSAKEVETVINQIGEVLESCVVGTPDEKWGEKVVAAVVLIPDASITDSDIKAHCKENLHDWKCPKNILFLDEIPRNTMGKMLKEEVKKLFQ